MKNINTASYNFKLKEGDTPNTVIAAICQHFPELKAKKFKYNRKTNTYTYPKETKLSIGGGKITVEKLTMSITQFGDEFYCTVDYTLDAPRLGFFGGTVVLIGLCLGVVPGLILLMLLAKSDEAIYEDIAPAKNRLSILFENMFDGKLVS